MGATGATGPGGRLAPGGGKGTERGGDESGDECLAPGAGGGTERGGDGGIAPGTTEGGIEPKTSERGGLGGGADLETDARGGHGASGLAGGGIGGGGNRASGGMDVRSVAADETERGVADGSGTASSGALPGIESGVERRLSEGGGRGTSAPRSSDSGGIAKGGTERGGVERRGGAERGGVERGGVERGGAGAGGTDPGDPEPAELAAGGTALRIVAAGGMELGIPAAGGGGAMASGSMAPSMVGSSVPEGSGGAEGGDVKSMGRKSGEYESWDRGAVGAGIDSRESVPIGPGGGRAGVQSGMAGSGDELSTVEPGPGGVSSEGSGENPF